MRSVRSSSAARDFECSFDSCSLAHFCAKVDGVVPRNEGANIRMVCLRRARERVTAANADLILGGAGVAPAEDDDIPVKVHHDARQVGGRAVQGPR